MSPKQSGQVIWFNPRQGYGFIDCDSQKENAYVCSLYILHSIHRQTQHFILSNRFTMKTLLWMASKPWKMGQRLTIYTRFCSIHYSYLYSNSAPFHITQHILIWKVNFALVLQKGGFLKAVKVTPVNGASPAKKKGPAPNKKASPKPKAAPKSAPKKKAATPKQAPKKKAAAAPKKKGAAKRNPGSQTGIVKGTRKSYCLIGCDNGDGDAYASYEDIVGGGKLKNGQTV